MEKREIILNLLKENPNTPFTPNEIAVILRNKKLKVYHTEVLRILLEEYTKDPEKIGYKKVARFHLFWFKENSSRRKNPCQKKN